MKNSPAVGDATCKDDMETMKINDLTSLALIDRRTSRELPDRHPRHFHPHGGHCPAMPIPPKSPRHRRVDLQGTTHGDHENK